MEPTEPFTPPHRQPIRNEPIPFFTPAQKQWLIMTAVAVLFTLLGKFGLTVEAPPFPAGLTVQIQEIQADVKELKTGQAAVMKAAGVPQQ